MRKCPSFLAFFNIMIGHDQNQLREKRICFILLSIMNRSQGKNSSQGPVGRN